jgi:predicted DNA-binding protein
MSKYLDEQIVVRVSAPLRTRLEQRAEQESRTVANLARVLLERGLQQQEASAA